jgi:hypothetical protein
MPDVKYFPNGKVLKKDGTPRAVQPKSAYFLVYGTDFRCGDRWCMRPRLISQHGYVKGRGYTQHYKKPFWACDYNRNFGCPTCEICHKVVERQPTWCERLLCDACRSVV